MARVLSTALLRHSTTPSTALKSSSLIPSSLTLTYRNRSKRSGKAQLIEIDLDSSSSSSSSASSSSSSSDGDFEILSVKKLDDIVRRIVVQRSTPDWLPFVPGSSFWVPPRRKAPIKVVDMVNKLNDPLSEEESLSLTSDRGWPCSSFLTRDSGPTQPAEVEIQVTGTAKTEPLEVELEVMMPEKPSRSDDEEK